MITIQPGIMKLLWCLLFFTNAAVVAKAQPTRDSILTTVNNLFTAMKTADTALLTSCFSSNAVLQTIQNDQGIIKVTDEKIAECIDFVGRKPKVRLMNKLWWKE